MDYWHEVTVVYHNSWDAFLQETAPQRLWLASARASRALGEVAFSEGDWLVFGCESRGLPSEVLQAFPENNFHIPMRSNQRSLNLSNAVAVVVYEGFRQMGYQGLL